MKIEDCLTPNEHLIIKEDFGNNRFLGHSLKRIIYTKKTGRNIEFGHAPISNITNITSQWETYRKGRIIAGIILLIIGLYLAIYYIGIPLIIIGIILLVTGLQQRGHLIINNNVSIFDFKTKMAQVKVNRFIKSVSALIYDIIPEQKVEIQPIIQPTIENDLKFCHSCGNKIKKVSTYCEFCGIGQ